MAVSGALSALVLGGVASAQDDRFDVTGTIINIDGPILTILTDDLIGKEQPIMVDVSQIRGVDYTHGSSIHLRVHARESDTFLAREVVREYPYVNGLDFGVDEWMTTRQDSIQAGVGNVPEDDEALKKQQRSPQNLRESRHGEDDDDKKNKK